MTHARCSCGALGVALSGPPAVVVACHCLDCQRRTGSPFGVGAFYPAPDVTISGPSRVYAREALSGSTVRNHFCPDCGSTIYWTADRLPGMVPVAIGAFADPASVVPDRSIFEQSRHHWVELTGNVAHFRQGSEAAAR